MGPETKEAYIINTKAYILKPYNPKTLDHNSIRQKHSEPTVESSIADRTQQMLNPVTGTADILDTLNSMPFWFLSQIPKS